MTANLRSRTATALGNPGLRKAIRDATDRFTTHREEGLDLANFEELRRAARATRAAIIADLPRILGTFADAAEGVGAEVHWAGDAAEARAIVTGIATAHGVELAVKAKSMLTEEIELNEALETAGIEVVETDLGEWIIQLAGQKPSHIIGPSLHLSKEDVAEIFNRRSDRPLPADPEALCAFARASLREKFLAADIGITGCNFAVAETGTVILVTNEGNGRMVTSLPPVHVVVMGMERIVETWDQLDLMMNLLPRSATGQKLSVYTTQVTGPRRSGETDGPEELHIVIVDNGRSNLLGTEFQEMLNCIRCGACLNVCPVYRQIGGHAYESVYSGPMGAVLTPLLAATGTSLDLAGASTLCGACYDACPVQIPLQDLLLSLRRINADTGGPAWSERAGWKNWARAWSRPGMYRKTVTAARRGSGALPAGLVPKGWRSGRTVPEARGTYDLRKALRDGKI